MSSPVGLEVVKLVYFLSFFVSVLVLSVLEFPFGSSFRFPFFTKIIITYQYRFVVVILGPF